MADQETSKGSILIAHLADSHLRDTQYAAPKRGQDFYQAFKNSIYAASTKVDILVLVGDIFDKSRPSPKVIKQLMEIHELLKSLGKPMLAVTGNHDWSSPTWVDTLFPKPEGDDVTNVTGIIPIDSRTVTFHGHSFAGIRPWGPQQFRNHLAETTAQARPADVVLYHGFVDGVVPMYAGSKNPLHVDELPISKDNKAWLLGDIHVQGHVTRDRPGGGVTHISYPGSTEMCSSSESTEKSVPIVRLSSDAMTIEGYEKFDIRPFISGEVKTEEGLEAIMARIKEVADQHPTVVVKFDKTEVPHSINRIHSLLDAQRSVIRCYPLPSSKALAKRETRDDLEDIGMEFFVSKRFEDDPELEQVALDLLARGEYAAHDIVAQMIEERLTANDVRDEGALT